MQIKIITGRLSLFILSGLIQSCSVVFEKQDGPPPGSVDVSSVPDAVPKVEPKSKYGNPESYVVNGKRYYVMNSSNGFRERGIASWYGNKFHGRRTSSGETYNMYAMTAAHKTLPLPTYVEVENLRNGKSIIVKVNDRGPFHENRIIDLSYTAAVKLDIIKTGTGLVEVRAINPGSYRVAGRGDAGKETGVLAGAGSGWDGDFYIQVGAFSSLQNARKVKSRLGILGDGLVRISEVLLDGKRIYRVRIGPINKIDVADGIVATLGKYGINDHHIVME